MCFLWVSLPDDIGKQQYQAPATPVQAGVAGSTGQPANKDLPRH